MGQILFLDYENQFIRIGTNFFEMEGVMFVSLFIMILISVLAIFIGHKCKKADPRGRPSTIVMIGESVVGFFDEFIVKNLNSQLKPLAPYFGTIAIYLPICFLIGLLGFPSPVTYYIVPFSLGLLSFILIHSVSVKYTKFTYFNRFLQPIFVFLPINLVTVFAPIVSFSFRLLGNALAGAIILQLVYGATAGLSEILIGWTGLHFNFIGPLVTPPLHAYFDVFGSLVQTLVFVYLSTLLIGQEVPSEE